MLVERRRDSMPVAIAARVAATWLAVSLLLLFVNIGSFANRLPSESGDLSWLMALLAPIIGLLPSELITFVAIPLLTLGTAMMLAARLSWRLVSERTVVMTCLAMGLSAPLLLQMSPWQVAHYGWQVICALIALNGLIARNPRIGGWICGLSIAVWLAISTELWPISAAICAIAALRWLRNRAERMWLVHITQALAVGSIIMFLSTGGVGKASHDCGAIGLAQIAMFCWAGLTFSVLSRVGPIPTGTLLGGYSLALGGALGIYLLGAPGCAITLQPLWYQELSIILENIALPMIGIWAAIHLAARNVDWLRHWWFDYALLLFAALSVIAVTGNGGAIAAALAAVPLGWQLQLWLDHIGRVQNPIKRTLALILLTALLMPSLFTKLVPLMDSAGSGHNVAQSAASLGIAFPHG